MRILIYVVSCVLMLAILIVLFLVGVSYGQDMQKRALANECREEFDQCFREIPHWNDLVEVIIVKDVPEEYKYLCGYVTVTELFIAEPYKRYIYRYTQKEARALNIVDMNKDHGRDFNLDAWTLKRDKLRVTCKIKEDKCRANIGFKPRYVDNNYYNGKIFNKYIYNKEIE